MVQVSSGITSDTLSLATTLQPEYVWIWAVVGFALGIVLTIIGILLWDQIFLQPRKQLEKETKKKKKWKTSLSEKSKLIADKKRRDFLGYSSVEEYRRSDLYAALRNDEMTFRPADLEEGSGSGCVKSVASAPVDDFYEFYLSEKDIKKQAAANKRRASAPPLDNSSSMSIDQQPKCVVGDSTTDSAACNNAQRSADEHRDSGNHLHPEIMHRPRRRSISPLDSPTRSASDSSVVIGSTVSAAPAA